MAGKAMVKGGRGALLPGVSEGSEVKAMVDRLSRGLGIDDHGKQALAVLPTAVERQMLRRRAEELEKQISPIGGGDKANPGGPGWSRARASMMLLLGGYDSMNYSDPDDTADLYLGWLSDLPEFAISEACRRVGRGLARWRNPETGRDEVLGVKRMPSHAALHMVARGIAADRCEELWRIERLLRIDRQLPKPVSDAERKRVADQFAKLASSLRAPLEKIKAEEKTERPLEAKEIEARAAAHRRQMEECWRAEGYEPFYTRAGTIQSPAMYQSMGDWPPTGAVKMMKGKAINDHG